jgi:hypothetical protein
MHSGESASRAGSLSGLTFITAVLPSASEHLPATAASIEEARDAIAEDISWIIVVDGPGEFPSHRLPRNTLVLRPDSPTGLAAARNAGLAAARTEWIMPLDADDLIDAAGFSALWSLLPSLDVDWCAGNVEILGGGRSPHYSPVLRHFGRRELESCWTTPFAFHANAVVVRRSRALSVGGWPPLAVSEDLGLVFALNRAVPGAAAPYTIMHYRLWPKQMTQASDYRPRKADCFRLLGEWINASRAEEGLPPVAAPDPLASYRTPQRPAYWQTAAPGGPASGRS